MRVFFKALASVGMIVLSTAAAIGIRHLVRKRRNRHEDQPAEPAPEANKTDASEQEPEQETADNSESVAEENAKEDTPAE